MDFRTLYDRMGGGYYNSTEDYPAQKELPPDTVLDEEKPVRWNREEVARLNAERKKAIQAYRESESKAVKRFQDDLIQAVMTSYNLTKAQATVVFNQAWSDGHSGGYHEVVSRVQTCADFAASILAS